MFKPLFTITPKIANALIRLEALRISINDLDLAPKVLNSLRELARLSSIHYSTMIEGNRLTQEEIIETLEQKKVLRGRERDQKEVFGYQQAFYYVEDVARKSNILTEKHIQHIHALVMAAGNTKIKPTPYRIVQNVIRESNTRAIVYLPPEPQDVPVLMNDLVNWIIKNPDKLPIPLLAGIAHYQYATIHPYIDGNGRTARLLTSLILHIGGYGLRGIFSLDDYYANDLPSYYHALDIGPSHNYYMGRAESDITKWVEYFCSGMVRSFEKAHIEAQKMSKKRSKDTLDTLNQLDLKQRKIISLFEKYAQITSKDIQETLVIHERAARALCQQWTNEGFLVILDPSKKSRTYGLAPEYEKLLDIQV